METKNCEKWYRAVRNLVNLSNDLLTIGHISLDLKKHRRIFVVGGGKATYPIVNALEEILGDRITDGVVVCKIGQSVFLQKTRIYYASHPIPDQDGCDAAIECMNIAKVTGPGDIVFACITGGSSALMPLPVDGISIEDKKKVNRLLLSCGANIYEINAVRKHLSKIKGGNLARAIHPEACLINLTVSDVTGDELDYITDPTVADTSLFSDAGNTLDKYDLWKLLPDSVADYIRLGGSGRETVKEEDLKGRQRHDFILVKSDAATEAALKKIKDLGFQSLLLSTTLEGESRELGMTFACIAREIDKSHRPVGRPGAVIGGGETTARVTDAAGKGGPNQEFVLGAALGIEGIANVVVVGLDTDGTDGPTELAGGVVDGFTVAEAEKEGLKVYNELVTHNASIVLEKTANQIYTGATGTNVNDLKFMLVG